jgi:hypothetical protein
MKNAVSRDINTVDTSQEIHYFSATEPNRLMLCKILVFAAVTMKNFVFWNIKLQFVPLSNTLYLGYRVHSVNAV